MFYFHMCAMYSFLCRSKIIKLILYVFFYYYVIFLEMLCVFFLIENEVNNNKA